MSYLPVENNIAEAVKEVNKIYFVSAWKYSFCVGQVAKRFNLDFTFLFSKCRENANKNRAKKTAKAYKRKYKNPEEVYGGESPYWIEK